MTTITEAGHNLAGLEGRLLDEIVELTRTRDETVAYITQTYNARIQALRDAIGSDEAEERKAA